MKHVHRVPLALAVPLATLALAACGSSESGSDNVQGQFEPVPGAPAAYEGLAGEATLERSEGGTVASLKLTGLEPKKAYVAHLHTEGCDGADPGGPHFKFDPGGSDEPPNEIHLEFESSAAGSAGASASNEREVPVGEAGSIVLHQDDVVHLTAENAPGGEAVLVHEGHEHEGAPHGDHGGSDAIACAELEGGSGGAVAVGAPTIVVRGGEPVGGIEELEFSAGEQVRFNVESDVADEVHVHGYDLMEDVPAGGTVGFDFPAGIEGIFEVELEGRKEQIAELRVNP